MNKVSELVDIAIQIKAVLVTINQMCDMHEKFVNKEIFAYAIKQLIEEKCGNISLVQ